MLRNGILNAGLAGALARPGQTHQVVIADAGLSLPYGVPSCAVVDLTLVAGIPRFEQALDAVLDAIVVDRAETALESQSRPRVDHRASRRPRPHLTRRAEGAVARDAARGAHRESTPYAKVILHCGVPF